MFTQCCNLKIYPCSYMKTESAASSCSGPPGEFTLTFYPSASDEGHQIASCLNTLRHTLSWAE